MFWKKRPPFCDLILHPADTELGEYSILDATIFAHGGISAFFQPPPQGRARKPPKSQVLAMHCESIIRAKACCEQHYLENGDRPATQRADAA
jgi:hypothetical protein